MTSQDALKDRLLFTVISAAAAALVATVAERLVATT